MNLIEQAIRQRVTTAVGVILILLFGGIALTRIPIQLIPTVEQPIITVTTMWPGASPQEVERQIVQEQEEQLKSLEGLSRMDSTSAQGQGTVTLIFQIGVDQQAILLNVANRLEQVQRYPEDALKPVIRASTSETQAIAWFQLRAKGDGRYQGDIYTEYDYVDDFIRPELERVPGVSVANILGGRPHEMHFIVDPAKLAAHGVSITQLSAALQRENNNISGGDFDEGKNRYVVRTVSEYASPADIENIVIGVRNGIPTYARDVGFARLGYRKAFGQGKLEGRPGVAVTINKQPGANVLDVMNGIKATAVRLNRDLLEPRGLELAQFSDETEYIESAIGLVRESLYYGGALAAVVLLLFLRSLSSTLIVTVAMPISVIGTFLMMLWFNRSLNVISLAGLAFAVGMVVDNSIVVLENIYRHRQMGKSQFQAAYDGAREVWGAVLASTLTTVAVFVPIVFIQEEAGQLFRDIAIAISCSVALSMLVAMTVIPAMSAKILHAAEPTHRRFSFHNLFGLLSVVGRAGNLVSGFVYWMCGRVYRRVAIVALFTAASLYLSVQLMPKVEYLPTGNANFIFGMLFPPPGYNLDEMDRIGEVYEDGLKHLVNRPPEEAQSLPGGGLNTPFFVGFSGRAFAGGRAGDPTRVSELIPEFQKITAQVPGAVGAFRQQSLFQRGPSGSDVEINVTGPDPDQLKLISNEVLTSVRQNIPGAQAAPAASIDAGVPELQVLPDRKRAMEAGISGRDLGFMVSALIDGVKATDYQWQGKRIDLKIVANDGRQHRTHLIEELPIATPGGRVVTLGSVASVKLTNGPIQIAHRERQRAETIRVTAPPNAPLEAVMDDIREKVIRPLQQEGKLAGAYRAILSGSADKLTQTWQALRWNFLLALVISYLLMAALFQSFTYPFVILFTMPLASLGGFLGLAVMNRFSYQPLDVLTMLGFFILVGTAVNNAILLVDQSLNHMRTDGMTPRAAIRAATQNRLRPIFMSVLTSVFGMLPLVLFPGPGSELYRGLGSVVIGGLLISTVFTLLVIPALFSLVLDARTGLARLFSGFYPGRRQEAPSTGD